MRKHVIIVSPHIRWDGAKHPNAFEARLAGSDALLCVSETPLLTAARALLAGGGWTARCPAHDDRTLSLSICKADNTRELVAFERREARRS